MKIIMRPPSAFWGLAPNGITDRIHGYFETETADGVTVHGEVSSSYDPSGAFGNLAAITLRRPDGERIESPGIVGKEVQDVLTWLEDELAEFLETA